MPTRNTRLKMGIVLTCMIVLFLPIPSRGNLDKTYTTSQGHFTFSYTDDFVNQALNAVSLAQVQDFGNILEEVRTKELSYGFNSPGWPKPVEIFEQGFNAHGGCSGMNYDPFWLGSTAAGYQATQTEPYMVTSHEFLHVIQHCYPNGWKAGKWIREGQARSIQDKLFSDLDTEPGLDYLSYFGQVSGYLSNPDRVPLMDLSYDAALFWTYVAEKYGSLQTEPDRGLDAFVQFWESAESLGTPADEITTFNQMLTFLGHGSTTLDDVFTDFIVANYAKDLPGPHVPSKYHYEDETQDPGHYPRVELNLNESITQLQAISGTDVIEPWMPKYYLVRPQIRANTKMPLTVDVKQLTDNSLFFDVLEIKDGDIVSETRMTGRHFTRTLMTTADEVLLIVGGLRNEAVSPAKYHYSFSSKGGSIAINIQSPRSIHGKKAHVGDISKPGKFLAVVEVLSSTSPLKGLTRDDFHATVGGKNAEIITSAEVSGLYFLSIQAPPQDSGLYHDLTIEVAGFSDTEYAAIAYDIEATDSMIAMDRSLSMAFGDKIFAAKGAAQLYVDSLGLINRLGIVAFGDGAVLIQSLLGINNRSILLNKIDGINAQDFYTSIGSGLLRAQNTLTVDGLPQRTNRIILLTDGIENQAPYVSTIRDLLIDNGTALDVIFLGVDANTATLQNLVEETGGNVYFAFDPGSGTLSSDLANIYRLIAEKTNGEQRVFSTVKQVSGPLQVEESFQLDQSESASVIFYYNSTKMIQDAELSLRLPNGTTLSPTFTSQVAGSASYYGYATWYFSLPREGTYSILLSSAANGVIEYFAEASVKGAVGIQFQVGLTPNERLRGSKIPLIVSLSSTEPITDATVTARVLTGTSYHDFRTWTIHLYDDGAHGDGLPRDGVYGNWFTRTSEIGLYSVSVNASGSTIDGNFTRMAERSFQIKAGDPDDSDGDGLPDVWELQFDLDPNSAQGDDGTNGDPDNDGLPNKEEFLLGTSPINSDTDHGGENDNSEVKNNRDPYHDGDDNMFAPYLQAYPSDARVTIHFSVRPEYESMILYRSIFSNLGFVQVASNIAPTGTFTDSGLVNGVTYYYKMKAVSATDDESAFSTVISATPNSDVVPPIGYFTINDGARVTNSTTVTLRIFHDDDAVAMRIASTAKFDGVPWQPLTTSLSWVLAGEGVNFVFMQFKDAVGNVGGIEDGHYVYQGILVNTSVTFSSTTTPSVNISVASPPVPSLPVSWSVLATAFTVSAITVMMLTRKKRSKI